MLTQYTSYDEIRAALGVAPEEITDDVLSLPNYEQVLLFDLLEAGDFDPTLSALFLTLIDKDATPTPSVNQARYVSIVKVYSTYVVARHLTVSLDLFAPMIIKDAKTELVRKTKDPFSDTKAGVETFYQQMRARVIAAYIVLFPNAVEATRTPTIPLLASSLGSDPVLGT